VRYSLQIVTLLTFLVVCQDLSSSAVGVGDRVRLKSTESDNRVALHFEPESQDVFWVSDGAKAEIIEMRHGEEWIHLRFQNGNTGWTTYDGISGYSRFNDEPSISFPQSPTPSHQQLAASSTSSTALDEPNTTTTPNAASRMGHHIREWSGVVFGVIGSVLGLTSIIRNRRNETSTKNMQVNQDLAEAWDILGGETGAEEITHFVRDRAKIQLARRLIEEKALVLDPRSAKAYRHQGAYLRAIGESSLAIKSYQKAINIDPNYARAYTNLGTALKDAGRVSEAIAAHRMAIEKDPTLLMAYTNLGLALLAQGKREEAIKTHRIAIEKDSNYSTAYYNLALAIRIQDKQKAAGYYRKAISLDPRNAAAHNNLANILRSEGKNDEALGYFHNAVTLDPTNATYRVNIGLAYSEMGQTSRACEEFREAIAANPRHSASYENLGEILRKERRLEESLDVLTSAVELGVGTARAYQELGLTMEELENFKDSKKAYMKAIELDPRSAIIFARLACVNLALGDTSAALDYYVHAVWLNHTENEYPELSTDYLNVVRDKLQNPGEISPSTIKARVLERFRERDGRSVLLKKRAAQEKRHDYEEDSSPENLVTTEEVPFYKKAFAQTLGEDIDGYGPNWSNVDDYDIPTVLRKQMD